jgi:hypothetical protein
MNGQAQLWGSTGRTDSPAVLADLEVDYTPVGVALQLMLMLEKWTDKAPRILDPAAGSGCWGRAARAVFGDAAYLVGVEPRESERGNVEAAYNEAHTTDLLTYIAGEPEPFDLVVGNPPFSAFAEFWPLHIQAAGLLRPGGTVSLYGLSQWGQSSDASTNLRRWSPSYQWRLGGRPAHREDGKTDSREYSLWGWDVEDFGRRLREPGWWCRQLPELPLELRRWTSAAVPGTYAIDPALVAEIRARYL